MTSFTFHVSFHARWLRGEHGARCYYRVPIRVGNHLDLPYLEPLQASAREWRGLILPAASKAAAAFALPAHKHPSRPQASPTSLDWSRQQRQPSRGDSEHPPALTPGQNAWPQTRRLMTALTFAFHFFCRVDAGMPCPLLPQRTRLS
jgi:hypothetical protein